MASTFRHLAPAGAPIAAGDLVRWAATALSRRDVRAALAEALSARLGVGHVFPTSTGRAGMTVLLRALRRLAPAGRTEVVLPAYTCYSVAASVMKAGLTPRMVDVATDTLDYAHDALAATDFSRVLAIVATNLYGLPNDMPALERLARGHGVFLVDDAAQALGASVGGRPSGTWGDAGLLSFDKGKNVSAIDGGVVVTGSEPVAGALAREMRDLSRPSAGGAGILTLKALVYFALLRPWLYWIPDRIPQLELGRTVFTTDFPLSVQSRPQLALAVTMLERLDPFTRARVATASALLEGLPRSAGLTPIRALPHAAPVYLRLPLLVDDAGARQPLIERLRAAGIGATGSYPRSIAELPEVAGAPGASRAPGAAEVARRIITLPTHPFVRPADVGRMLAALGHGAPATAQDVERLA